MPVKPDATPPVPLAPGLSGVAPSLIRRIADVAFGMEDVLKLHFGESDQPTPDFIKEAAVRALAEGFTYYTANAGLPTLRAAIAETTATLHGVRLDPQREVLVTASGVQALNVAIRCTLDPGDEAIVLTPELAERLVDRRPLRRPGARSPAALVRATLHGRPGGPRSRPRPAHPLLVYASPSNPLGWVARAAEQDSLLAFCRRNGLWLLADEVYERIYFDGPVAPSILRRCTRDDAVIVVQSFSKSYCMTGWRLGWLTARADLVGQAAQLNEFIVSHAPSMVQRAGETALRRGEGFVQAMREQVARRVGACHRRLQSVRGVSVAPPEGSFYLFPRIEGVADSLAFALALLKEHARGGRAGGGLRPRRRGGGAHLLRGGRVDSGAGAWSAWRVFIESGDRG